MDAKSLPINDVCMTPPLRSMLASYFAPRAMGMMRAERHLEAIYASPSLHEHARTLLPGCCGVGRSALHDQALAHGCAYPRGESAALHSYTLDSIEHSDGCGSLCNGRACPCEHHHARCSSPPRPHQRGSPAQWSSSVPM